MPSVITIILSNVTGILSVRPLELNDHASIVDYFLNSDKDFLRAMGVDTSKLPSRHEWIELLNSDFPLPLKQKNFFYLIWLLDGKAIGHSNINKIIFGSEAYMHLHLWQGQTRQRGMGVQLVRKTLPFYFDTFKLKYLYCEPSASNPAPNRTLQKAGFKFIKSYDTTPGWINFYQTVNRWCMTEQKFRDLT